MEQQAGKNLWRQSLWSGSHGSTQKAMLKKLMVKTSPNWTARMHWRPSWAEGKLIFRIVIRGLGKKRVKKIGRASVIFFYQDSIEDRGSGNTTELWPNGICHGILQHVMKHHQKEGMPEILLKKEKYHLKLNNFSLSISQRLIMPGLC